MNKLSANEIQLRLSKFPKWTLVNREGEDVLLRMDKGLPYSFIVEAVKDIAFLAIQSDHHPEVRFAYDYLEIKLSTHSEGGVTEKDFQLAREIDRILEEK